MAQCRCDLNDQRTTRAIAEDPDIDDKVFSLLSFVALGEDLPSGLKLLGGAHMTKMITPFARLSVARRKAEACLKVKTEPSDFTNCTSSIADLKHNIDKALEAAASLPEGRSSYCINMELAELLNDCKAMCHIHMKSVVIAVQAQLKGLKEASSAPAKAIQPILDSEKIDPDALLAATNTDSQALRTQWVRYSAWRDLPSETTETLSHALPHLIQAPGEKLTEEDVASLSAIHSCCASMATIQAMHRSLKPSETRITLLKATYDMWMAGDIAVCLPPKLSMLFDLARAQSEGS